jgi:CRISPR-associated endonuclease Cas2
MNNKIKNFKQNIQNFLDSDSGYATATKVVFATIALAGIITVIAIAPNVFHIFGRQKRSKRYSDRQLKNAFYNLKKQKLIEVIQEKDDKIKIRLTNKGKKRLKEFSIDTLTIPQPQKWDKKWRMVIFDIPNKFVKAREALRKKLKELGFYQLQKSVWAYPYPCQDEILFVAEIFKIQSFINILTVEECLHDYKLRKFFEI